MEIIPDVETNDSHPQPAPDLIRGRRAPRPLALHASYPLSQIVHKRIEEANGWIKQVGCMAQTKLRGVKCVEWMFVFRAAAYNLIRLLRLLVTGCL
jgi:hypothetical protein